jgi:DNA-binding GntR family transcriptional regulator
MTSAGRGRALARASVVDALADALRSRILSGDLRPGAPLREEALATAYEVSRHTLRAALRALAAEGLIRVVPNRGATVARLAAGDLVPLFELRAALEVEACRLTLERWGGTLPTEVHDRLDELVRACRAKGSDWSEIAEAHARFHQALVAGAASPRIEDAYTRLAAELNLFLAQLRPVWSRRRMVDHHRALVHDLETNGDVIALRRHLQDGLEAVAETPDARDATGAIRARKGQSSEDSAHRARASRRGRRP